MPASENSVEAGRKRLIQVFSYLEALNHHRNPAKRHLDDQLWHLWFRDLAEHPSIRIATASEFGLAAQSDNVPKTNSEPKAGGDFVLRVRRPELTPCPPPPDLLLPWLEKGWQDATPEVRVRPTQDELDKEGRSVIVRFEDDESRPRDLDRWLTQRASWLLNERPARDAIRIFEKLYEIRGQIEREGETVELVVGDGILSWRRNDGGVYHPVLLQRVQLEFDPTIPEFSIVESERPVELYSALFQSMPDVEGKVLAQVRQELEEGKFHPLGGEDTSGLLRGLVVQLSARGEFSADAAPKAQGDDPVMGRSPVILLRHRNLGFAVAIQSVLESLGEQSSIPAPLMRIVGIEGAAPISTDNPGSSRWVEDCHPVDVLLSKPANPEQVRIAQRLEQHGSVLVQGPPGTGKTHTIANLIGHLLAEGKSILVTSHTSKALRVVRDQVVSQLQPLCVSVLDSDVESRKQLEKSINEIVSRLSHNDAYQLESSAEDLRRRREALIAGHRELTNAILNARADEYREIVIGGQGFTPSEAARIVHRGRDVHDYIPSPVELGSPLPLSEEEISELYATNDSVSPSDEIELRGLFPDPQALLLPTEFDALAQERRELATHDLRYRADLWGFVATPDHLKALDDLSRKVGAAAAFINQCEAWQLEVVLAGYYGGNHRKPWESFFNQLDETWNTLSLVQDALIEHDPKLPEDFSLEQAHATSKDICTHLGKNGDLSFLALLIRPSWKKFIRGSRVGSVQPSHTEHFAALRGLAEVTVCRTQLAARWTKQMVPLGVPTLEMLGPFPEEAMRQFSRSIKKCLDWYASELEPLEAEAVKLGLRFRHLLEEQPSDFAGGELRRLAKLLNGPLQRVLAERAGLIRWQVTEAKIAELRARLGNAGGDTQSTTVAELREALTTVDATRYRNALERMNALFTLRKDLERRQELLRRLGIVAPGWAEAIRRRTSVHGSGRPPRDLPQAWRWRQFNDELERRSSVSLEELLRKSERIGKDIRDVTAELIERKAWAAQLRRTERNLQQQQALIGWLDTVNKMGKETGIGVPKLKAAAARLMGECRGAVPVWIMPLSRVAENFDPRTTRFDVVIIDEASQADVMAILAVFLAHKCIVVGDHEQVSPSAVGQKIGVVEHLIDEFLEGIPNRHLYDEKTSIYDLARQSFGGTTRLVEHFRCVPEIIQFSNQLSYEGAIRPLRDASKVELKPHVVAYRVSGALSFGKENPEEAEQIAALVVAATEQPEYADKTFGIISLVGDQQAYKIDSLLRRRLSEEEFKLQFNILCGNPAQFQGDERDVVFLSVVDTSDGGVLKIRDEPMFRQRFNVAASRAKDQMWVVHSIDPRSHLKPGDLRRRLIEYAEDPCSVLKALASVESSTESPFEREIAARLVRAGFKVIPQWRVGHYRIDLVVEGNGKRIAIECDGDKFHSIERLEDDMARQAVLERLGWTFVRIRGGQFFRQPDEAMGFIFDKLRVAGIEPQATEIAEEGPGSQGQELIERVIRRAQEIRREWKESNDSAHITAKSRRTKTNQEGQIRERSGGNKATGTRERLSRRAIRTSSTAPLSLVP